MSIFSFEKSFADTLPETHYLFSLPDAKNQQTFDILQAFRMWIRNGLFSVFQINKNDRNNFFNELAMIASMKRPISQNAIACVCVNVCAFLRSPQRFFFRLQLHCGKMC